MAATIQTKVFNGTDKALELKEGNGGNYRYLDTIPKNESSKIDCDVNATYREYWVGTAAGIAEVVITSDDCAECSDIRIVPAGVGRSKLEKTLRSPAATQAESTSGRTCVI
ncbi:hypothetical protein KC19_11G118400 [Ceratodon purpureus]|uniref:DUF7748 domain-containing protein n=1 Tax=Ceratodon purpureus TaxID=3225 RepID=A0A8T0GJK7_CERPU|nr:hypothetical protein KC19_11G118400 [Ceratodon purpureus]